MRASSVSFSSHCPAFLIFTLYRQLGEFAPFAISWYAPEKYTFAASYAVLAAICFGHLRAIGPSRLKLKGGIVAGLAIASIAAQWLMQSGAGNRTPGPRNAGSPSAADRLPSSHTATRRRSSAMSKN